MVVLVEFTVCAALEQREDFDLSIGRHPFDKSYTGAPGRLWSSKWLQTLVGAEPAVIVYSAGDADISVGAAPQSVLSNFKEFVQAGSDQPKVVYRLCFFRSSLPHHRAIGPLRLMRICSQQRPYGNEKTSCV